MRATKTLLVEVHYKAIGVVRQVDLLLCINMRIEGVLTH